MRTIKFRGKRIDNGEWAYGYLYRSEKESWITDSININLSTHRNFAWWQVNPESVGEFIGVNGANVTPIYEGDIFEDSYYGRCKVVWSNGWSMRHIKGGKNRTGKQRIPMAQTGRFRVLGNIYEHSELLK